MKKLERCGAAFCLQYRVAELAERLECLRCSSSSRRHLLALRWLDVRMHPETMVEDIDRAIASLVEAKLATRADDAMAAEQAVSRLLKAIEMQEQRPGRSVASSVARWRLGSTPRLLIGR
jgi:uncharacterized protein (DUF1499 family)